jgi:hypothetical protein
VPGAFDGYRQATLKFQAGSSEAARQNFALRIDKLQEELGIFVVDILNASLFEATILLLLGLASDAVDRGGSYFVTSSHDS